MTGVSNQYYSNTKWIKMYWYKGDLKRYYSEMVILGCLTLVSCHLFNLCGCMHTILVGTLRFWLVKNENSTFVCVCVCVYKGSVVLWTMRVFTILCTLAWVVRFFVVDASGLYPQWMSCGWIYMYLILSDHLFFFVLSFSDWSVTPC